jgi:hypothetical protein
MKLTLGGLALLLAAIGFVVTIAPRQSYACECGEAGCGKDSSGHVCAVR